MATLKLIQLIGNVEQKKLDGGPLIMGELGVELYVLKDLFLMFLSQ